MTILMKKCPISRGGYYSLDNPFHRVNDWSTFCSQMEQLFFDLFENPFARPYFEKTSTFIAFDGVQWKLRCSKCGIEEDCKCLDKETRPDTLAILLYTDPILQSIFHKFNIAVEL